MKKTAKHAQERDCEYLEELEKRLRERNSELDAVKRKHQPLIDRINQLKSCIEKREHKIAKNIMGDIKPGCWVEVATDNGDFIGYFRGYDERDGYEIPVFVKSYEMDGFEYNFINNIKKVSQKVATDYIKSGCPGE